MTDKTPSLFTDERSCPSPTAIADLLIQVGEIVGAEDALGSADADSGDPTTLCWIRSAIERGDLDRANDLISNLHHPDAAGARVLAGDLVVRGRQYDDHYDLVFAAVRSHHLDNAQLGTLALQTGELAVLSANPSLAADLFDFAIGLLRRDSLNTARAEIGRRVVGVAPSRVGHHSAEVSRTASGTVPNDDTVSNDDTVMRVEPATSGAGDELGTSPLAVLASIANVLSRVVRADTSLDALNEANHLDAGHLDTSHLDAAHLEASLLEAAHLDATRGNEQPAKRLREGARRLAEFGLVDLGHRLDVLSTALSGRHPPSHILPDDLAHCPWVTTELLYSRFEHCDDAEFDYWADALERRAATGPHSSLVVETSDVVQWARSIYEQHQKNVALDRAIEQTRSGWRELANLTSNEIRGLLTSLGVAADLRRAGSATPSGLELALVHRIAALTTMTQLGATEAPTDVERPNETGSNAAELLERVIAGERPIFEWAQRHLEVVNDVGDDVIVDVNAPAMSDMLRWLLLSATTGSLSDASIRILATTRPVAEQDGTGHDPRRMLSVQILSRTPAPPKPERHRELGLGTETTAHRAAVMLIRSWNGTFSASYNAAGLDISIELPAHTNP